MFIASQCNTLNAQRVDDETPSEENINRYIVKKPLMCSFYTKKYLYCPK